MTFASLPHPRAGTGADRGPHSADWFTPAPWAGAEHRHLGQREDRFTPAPAGWSRPRLEARLQDPVHSRTRGLETFLTGMMARLEDTFARTRGLRGAGPWIARRRTGHSRWCGLEAASWAYRPEISGSLPLERAAVVQGIVAIWAAGSQRLNGEGRGTPARAGRSAGCTSVRLHPRCHSRPRWPDTVLVHGEWGGFGGTPAAAARR